MAKHTDKPKETKADKLAKHKAKQTAEYKSSYGGRGAQKAGKTKQFLKERSVTDDALIKARRAASMKEAENSTMKNGDYMRDKKKHGTR